MGKIIAITNHKGGVGKTTTASALGAALAKKGFNTLLIDLDPQASLTSSLMLEEPAESIYKSFKERKPLPIMQIKENLSIVPAELELANTELELSGVMYREYILQELIQPIADKYSYIILDCPPSLGILTLNALVAATDLYITLTAEVLPAKGLSTLSKFIGDVQRRANKSLKLAGVIITLWQERNLNKAIEDLIKENFGELLLNTKIRKNVALAEAPFKAEDIFTYAPNSNGAKDYESLAEEIIAKG